MTITTLWGSQNSNHRSTKRLYKKAKRYHDVKCFYCNEDLHATTVTIDHLVSRGHGGNNSRENKVFACYWCNQTKSYPENENLPFDINVVGKMKDYVRIFYFFRKNRILKSNKEYYWK